MRCVGVTLTTTMGKNNEVFMTDDSWRMGRATNMKATFSVLICGNNLALQKQANQTNLSSKMFLENLRGAHLLI
jgi:hypothetical protein